MAVAVAMAGCRNGPETPDASRPVRACDLVTRAQAAAALGAPARPPDATADQGADALAGRSGCAWSTDDGSAAVLLELVRNDDMATSVRRTGFSAEARYRSLLSREERSEPCTLGDRCLWVDERATLAVLVGTSFVTIEVAVPTPARARPLAEQIAADAIDRLARGRRAD